jgi:TonB-dependent SusC/RagA subfamily outer membrane receptor
MDGFDFINTNEDNAPFSFLNNLFWKQSISLQEEVGQQIFKHEITHIQQKHTWDRIYCQIITSIFWINPFNWFIQKELVVIHEFIADEEAVGNSNLEAFAKMLLQTHFGNHFLNPIHQFFYSSIKRRLTMLTKSSNTKYSYLRRVMVLPILMVTVCLVSIKVNASEKIEKTAREIQNTINLLVSDTTKPKKLTQPTPPTPPTPPNPSSVKQDAQNKMEEVAVGDKKTPLYIIDGVPLKSSLEVSKLNEDEFESISVLRNPSSISQYGNEGKNGVILITTKTGLKGNLQKKSDETKVYEYSAKEGLNGDVYYKKIEDGTVNGNNKQIDEKKRLEQAQIDDKTRAIQAQIDEKKRLEQAQIDDKNRAIQAQIDEKKRAETNPPMKVKNVPVKVTNLPVKVTNVPIKVTVVPKIQNPL